MSKLLPLLGPALLVILWASVTHLPGPTKLYLATVPETILALRDFFYEEQGLSHVLASLGRALVGAGIAAIVGMSAGVVLGWYRGAYRASESLIDIFRSVPAPALFPLALLIFGFGDVSKIATAAFVALWVVMLHTIQGMDYVPWTRRALGLVYHAGLWPTWRDIMIPSALPHIFVGLRAAVSVAFVVVIVSEMLVGASHGLGQELLESSLTYRVPKLYALIVLLGLLGYVLNRSLHACEKQVIHWRI